jgi:hypothetical protein
MNYTVDMAKLVFRDGCSSTQQLQRMAANADSGQLSRIPSKYWKPLRSLSRFITSRNEMAYESEVEFAKLLLLDEDKNKYNFWKEAFPILYNGSIEEVSQRETLYDWLNSLLLN